ncbi:MAG: hypothetical protein AAF479_03850, partial [Pseudomonadota bacterium]
MKLDHLYRDVTLPPMARVRRRFEVDRIDDLVTTLRATLNASGIAGRLTGEPSIAIGVGSRG